MRGLSGRLALAALALAGASAGCFVPDYHLPAGFSSSYHRQIYGMDPAPPPIEGGLATIATRPGIFYPETVFNDPPRTYDEESITARRSNGPMILGTDPLSPPPKVAKNLPDDF
jgi:hypothetical protein